MKEEVDLIVSKAYPRDLERGRAAVSPDVVINLKVSYGDVIEIEGKRKTVARLSRLSKQDWEKGIVKIDRYTRENANVAIGERVVLRRVEINNAIRVKLAPIEGSHVVFGGKNVTELVHAQIMKRALCKGDIIPVMSNTTLGEFLPFVVRDLEPDGAVVVTADTEVELLTDAIEAETDFNLSGITYEDIGGLKTEIQRVREMIELPFKHPEVFNRLGVKPPKGVILHGPPGCGKTLIAKAVANEAGASFFDIAGPEIVSKYYGESEKHLREVFEKARENAPSIIFIDEIDSIAPKREEVSGEVERRVVAQLLTIMDGLVDRGEIVVIGATNRLNAIDPALRRPGRFDREIELKVPDYEDRLEIIQVHTRNMPLGKDVDLAKLSEKLHGYVGADLEAVCREAAMCALRRFLSGIELEDDSIPEERLEELVVTSEDFKMALNDLEPSIIKDVLIETPKVGWKDVGGLEDVKKKLIEMVEWPIKYPEHLERMGIKTSGGIFLIGPPGCGKTLIAKAIAHESSANFIAVNGPEILSKWLGESERGIREIFRKARQAAPSIIFFDEIDAIAPARGMNGSQTSERVVNQLLTEMDGIRGLEGVVMLAATNRSYDAIDPAILRPGRFDRIIFVSPPSKEDRRQIFQIHTASMPLSDDVNLSELVDLTEDYLGSDIEALCTEAGLIALREDFDATSVKMRHFIEALSIVKPTMDENARDFYERMERIFRGSRRSVEANAYIG
ncbi:MAG: CdcH [Candidatus Syntrophoarchaeum caldarius]|uniref:CdcH n=1 Tax=Candidatus Syntropharchaeum caldarium TaxID=1838285 RepID=A0A1F2P9D9_9EURY|nr:MAG: CdcH [Candidatus Syntrophoarchaeum caldarius]